MDTISSLIKKELKLEKLAKTPWKENAVGNLKFDQVVKITKTRMDSLGTNDLKNAVKQIVASCVSFGCTIEGKNPKEIIKEIDSGKWDSKFT